MATTMAAYLRKIPVAHVEAGLRTYALFEPFPGEIDRRIVSAMATLHFSPTQHAAANLMHEGGWAGLRGSEQPFLAPLPAVAPRAACCRLDRPLSSSTSWIEWIEGGGEGAGEERPQKQANPIATLSSSLPLSGGRRGTWVEGHLSWFLLIPLALCGDTEHHTWGED